MINSVAGSVKRAPRELFLDELFRGVADYLLDCEDEDGRLPENLVDASLDEAQQSLLASLVFQEDEVGGQPRKDFYRLSPSDQ